MKKKKIKPDQEIIDLKKQIEELIAGWQRTQADFDNFQKRIENEKLENMAFAKAEFIIRLTPVLDNFQRAFKHLGQNDKVIEGFKQIQKQLEDILKDEGLEKIPAHAGTKFNPEYHEAISYEENDLPADTVISEFESGWQFADKVIKPAKVRVSKGK